jgi:hypothetical protein
MKHASAETLDALEPLLMELRLLAIVEKSHGTFYSKKGAFVHFHEDPEGIFADVKCKDGWQRLPANSKTDFKRIVSLAKAQI